MDSFQLNKIAGAVLAALLIVFGSKMLTDIIFDSHAPEKPGYVVEVNESGAHGSATADKPGTETAPISLADADPAKGEKIVKKCKACHSFDKGGANKVGPYLFGVFGRDVAGLSDFNYSEALKGKGGKWTLEFLDCFLKKPSKCVKGTTMGFAGLKKPADRANLIAYLKSLAD